MTREETVKNLLTELIDMIDNGSQRDLDRADEIAKTIIKALSQEPQCTEHPCLGNLCRYYKQPCDDAISREDALKLIYDFKENHTKDREKHPINYGTLLDLIRLIRELPPVTQKSETGHWINLEKKYKGQVLPFWGRYGCSKCGGYGEGTFNYCPNCGAKMESEDKE